MGRTLVMHIGTNKTGSTTLQNLLCANRPDLLAQGACYADTQRGANHLLLATMFTSFKEEHANVGKELWRGQDPQLCLADYRKSLAAEIRRLPEEVSQVIVSSEHFSQAVRKPRDLQSLKSFMDDLFDDYKVVVYLRRQDAHFASSFSQGLRGGRMQSPGFRNLSPYFHDYDYADLLNRWADIFGDAAMCPRIFERDTDKSYDVCNDFTNLLGLAPLKVTQEKEAARNISISTSGQRILLRIGRQLKKDTGRGFADTALWMRLATAVGDVLPGKGWRPTQAEARDFLDNYADTTEAVRSRWFPGRESLFPTDFSGLPTEAEPVDPRRDYEDACAVLLSFALKTSKRDQHVTRRKVDLAAKTKLPKIRKGALLQALRLHPADTESRLRLAAIQITEKAFGAARHNIEAVLKTNPEHPIGQKLAERLKRVERRTLRKLEKGEDVAEPAVPDAIQPEEMKPAA